MKLLRHLCASLVLTLLLAISVSADGDIIHTGYVPSPPTPHSQTTATSADQTSGNEVNAAAPLTQALLSIIESLSSIL